MPTSLEAGGQGVVCAKGEAPLCGTLSKEVPHLPEVKLQPLAD